MNYVIALGTNFLKDKNIAVTTTTQWYAAAFFPIQSSSAGTEQQSSIRRMDSYERVQVSSREEWRGWLKENHTQKENIWLVTFKKHVGNDKYLPYAEMVEEALCFGWIDSTCRKVDGDRTMHLLSPRKPKSMWSKINKDRVAKLIEQKLMTPAGLAKIDQAKQDGSWAFLDDIDAMVIPPDLATVLNKNKKAKGRFEAYSDWVKKQKLLFIKSAKQASTRVKRIRKVVEQAVTDGKT